MREIKFRAWEPKWHDGARCMIYPSDDFGCYLEPAGLNGTIDVLLKEGYALMQYTGLKDKNGREIYEGDIIKYVEDLGDKIYQGTVEWNEYFCGFIPFADYDSDCGVFIDIGSVKVIGNIYENPELIT